MFRRGSVLLFLLPILHPTAPSNLIDFILETKSWFCEASSKMLVFPSEATIYDPLTRDLIAQLNASRLVSNDYNTLYGNYWRFDCAIIFGADYQTVSNVLRLYLRIQCY